MAVTRIAGGVERDRGFVKEFVGKDVRGREGAEVYTRSAQFFDHFLVPQTMATNWVDTKTGTGTFAILNAGMGGVAELITSGASGDSNLDALIQSASTGSAWNPSKNALARPLSFECRAILGATSTVEVFFGFTNSQGRAAAGGINYALSTTSTLGTSVSDDGASFGYSSVPTSGSAFLTGGNPFVAVTSLATVDTVTPTNVVADTNYHIFRIELDVNGNATFLIDDVVKAVKGSAVTANIQVYPYFQITTRVAATRKLDIDYILVSGDLAATIT